MSIDFIRPEVDELRPRISVIGVGGAGGNAIANMMRADVQGVDFVVANTDAQSLNNSAADRRIQLGLKITQGLGAGSRPEIGRAAAEETLDEESDYGARFNSARVLSEGEAKRRIVESAEFFMWQSEHGPDAMAERALEALASVYADHPDYRDEWKP